MSYWAVYPAIGLVIFFVLVAMDVLEWSYPSPMPLVFMILWPIAAILLIWHWITVLQWKKRHRELVAAADPSAEPAEPARAPGTRPPSLPSRLFNGPGRPPKR